MMTDPISDMLARIRNAYLARHREVTCPSSRLKLAIAQVMRREGFLDDVRVEAERGLPTLRMALRYTADGDPIVDGLRRVSTPSRRVYVNAKQVPSVRKGLGISVLSTSKGVLSDRGAREASVGGEVLCEVW